MNKKKIILFIHTELIAEFIDNLRKFEEDAEFDGVLYRYEYDAMEIILDENINDYLEMFLDAYLNDDIAVMKDINFNVERLTEFE